MMFIAACVAILLPLILLALFKLSAKYSMAITALVVIVVAITLWHMFPAAVLASSLQGAHRALTVIWILIGAITLLYTVQNTKAVARIRQGFMAISEDMRVQVVIVGFAFLSLIEGASGFGTPAVVVAPLLIALGFRPIVAASIALISDTVACTFGAVGTPLVVGLENVSVYSSDLVTEVAKVITTLDLVIGTMLPFALIYVLVMWFGHGKRSEKWANVRAMAPWSLMVGATYSLTAFVSVRVLGVEFAAIIAGSVALVVSVITARRKFLLRNLSYWRDEAEHEAELALREKVPNSQQSSMSLIQAWSPYILIVIFLLVSRTVPTVKDFLLNSLDLSWLSILGFETINSAWPILYSPGTILLLAAMLGSYIQSRSLRPAGAAFVNGLRTAAISAFALIPTLIMVQVFTNSGNNSAGIEAMPIYIGEVLARFSGEAWLIFSPLLGSLGAFIAGSATVSSLTMASVQESVALSSGLPVVLVLAMQVLGAVAGNIIAIHNVVAAAAVVGLAHREGIIIRRVLPATVVYIAVVVVLGLVYLLLT
ncbi:L-lactate permease [Candidatus Saccharibacteria bacterium]|jgi:lactate permease|nr:L-lactate permease [Candidatus Saccharibacteria bacterium]